MTRRSLPLERVRGLLADARGLATDDARERLRRYGANAILESPSSAWADLARDTARDPMIWFLGVVGVVYAAVGQTAEAVTLLVAIVPLVGMDVFLHRRTQASTEGLKSRLAATAVVVRDGVEQAVPALDVVPGDLAIIVAGQAFPADGVVLAGEGVQVDESALTGEAYPVRKRALDIPKADGEASVASEHWTFAGTRLLTGRAAVRIVFTAGETVYGEIVRSALSGAHARTPLQRAIQRLVGALLAVAALVCVLLAVVRLAQGYGWVDALVSAVTLASAALPEEFPVVFTFFLGVGVYRLAKRQALVRRAVSVENIGRVSCICSDKTGTMTEGRLRLAHLLAAEDISEDELLRLASVASRGESGDPLDVAVLDAAARLAAVRPKALATYPFTETRKRESAIVADAGGVAAVTKGAAETVLALATMPEAERRQWSERVARLAGEGHKVIGCASHALEDAAATEEPGAGYRFAGLLAFEDPVREGVADAIARCREAGIHTIMVTGDHPLTAEAVARDLGLGGGAPSVVSGDELDARAARGGDSTLRRVDVIARATPAQKLTLVRALQRRGEIVAVTGDGVNDVPALQAADVGIAMGERGTRSAREVAAIVLLDDNFRTIVGAIAEGRQLFRNLTASFQYLLMIHIPLVVAAAALPLAGYPLLFLPVHIVWLEMIIHPTALLVFQELPAGQRLARVRTGQAARFFSAADAASLIAVGALLTALVVAGFLRSASAHGDVVHGRTMAMAALTLGSAAITAALSRLRTPAAWLVAAGSVLLSAVLIQTPAVASALHVSPLHLDDWATAAAGAALAGVLVVGFERVARRT